MSLCVLAGGETAVVAASLFTLSWTHSVEKVEWQEVWQVLPGALRIVEARVKGSGAGMEPPPDARLKDGWWVYVPPIGPMPELRLAASGATQSAWRLCADGDCRNLGAEAGSPIVLAPCP
jgi:hypothetical protein